MKLNDLENIVSSADSVWLKMIQLTTHSKEFLLFYALR
jgi:hypothetical protein